MTTTATHPAPPIVHPNWCVASLCAAIGPDREHRAVTLMARTADSVTVTVGLTRLDNPALDDWDHAHVSLGLDDGCDTDVAVHLHPDEADALADRLHADATRARDTDRHRERAA